MVRIAISENVAAQIVALLQSGKSQRSVAAQLRISLSGVQRAFNRYQETGNYKRRRGQGRKKKLQLVRTVSSFVKFLEIELLQQDLFAFVSLMVM